MFYDTVHLNYLMMDCAPVFSEMDRYGNALFLFIAIFFSKLFYLRIDLDLQRQGEDSTQNSHILYSQFYLLLTPYITMVRHS